MAATLVTARWRDAGPRERRPSRGDCRRPCRPAPFHGRLGEPPLPTYRRRRMSATAERGRRRNSVAAERRVEPSVAIHVIRRAGEWHAWGWGPHACGPSHTGATDFRMAEQERATARSSREPGFRDTPRFISTSFGPPGLSAVALAEAGERSLPGRAWSAFDISAFPHCGEKTNAGALAGVGVDAARGLRVAGC